MKKTTILAAIFLFAGFTGFAQEKTNDSVTVAGYGLKNIFKDASQNIQRLKDQQDKLLIIDNKIYAWDNEVLNKISPAEIEEITVLKNKDPKVNIEGVLIIKTKTGKGFKE